DADAQRAMGRLVRARALYERVAREPLTDDAPAPWVEAQAKAEQQLIVLDRLIPTLKVSVEKAPRRVRVYLDGRRLDDPEKAVRADPGEHTITVRGRRGARQRQRVTLVEGENKAVVIVWSGDRARERKPAPTEAPSPLDEPPPPVPRATPRNKPLVITGGTLGVLGVVGLSVGGGLLAGGQVETSFSAAVETDDEDDAGQSTTEKAGIGVLITSGVVVAASIPLLIMGLTGYGMDEEPDEGGEEAALEPQFRLRPDGFAVSF
ncbi:MAG: hypothetical protein AAGA56_06660, partial [Myxococcota bacterium]